MSRCYPYRPTGCVRNLASGDAALIEPIKLQREQEKPKTGLRKEKKREKREKKEKGKERKDKEKKKLHAFDNRDSEKLNDEKCSWDGGCLVKKIEYEEAEHLEKSSLTDEHDEPVCRQNICYLSDGTQSSNKRKRDCPPSNGITVKRNIIRIRLPSQKQRQDNALRSQEQSCSTSGRAPESLAQHKEIVGGECLGTNDKLSAISNSVMKEDIAEYMGCVATTGENMMEREVSNYKALIGDWVPPPIQYEPNDSDDQEWLFGTKKQGDGSKRFKSGDNVSSCQTLWPLAHYLPEADIYALPYSIPF